MVSPLVPYLGCHQKNDRRLQTKLKHRIKVEIWKRCVTKRVFLTVQGFDNQLHAFACFPKLWFTIFTIHQHRHNGLTGLAQSRQFGQAAIKLLDAFLFAECCMTFMPAALREPQFSFSFLWFTSADSSEVSPPRQVHLTSSGQTLFRLPHKRSSPSCNRHCGGGTKHKKFCFSFTGDS